MGTMPQGTKVLAFTIPQPHSVERRLGPTEALPAAEASGESGGRDVAGGCLLPVILLWGHLVHLGDGTGFMPGEGGRRGPTLGRLT